MQKMLAAKALLLFKVMEEHRIASCVQRTNGISRFWVVSEEAYFFLTIYAEYNLLAVCANKRADATLSQRNVGNALDGTLVQVHFHSHAVSGGIGVVAAKLGNANEGSDAPLPDILAVVDGNGLVACSLDSCL